MQPFVDDLLLLRRPLVALLFILKYLDVKVGRRYGGVVVLPLVCYFYLLVYSALLGPRNVYLGTGLALVVGPGP